MSEIRHVNAAAAIIHHEGRILLVLKEGWDQFSLPITRLREREDSSGTETGSAAAVRAIEEELGVGPKIEPGLLLDVELLQISGRLNELGHYQVQLFSSEVSAQEVAGDSIAKWLTPAEILSAEDVAPTARKVVEQLSEAALKGGRQFPPVFASPTRQSTASVAIITRDGGTEPEWLAQYNNRWGRYFLVGGHFEPGESPDDCLVREIQEELGETPENVEHNEGQQLQFTAWSTNSWQWTDYSITAFDVTLSDEASRRIGQDAANRWMNASEISCERCADGKLISPTMSRVLNALEKMAPPKSDASPSAD